MYCWSHNAFSVRRGIVKTEDLRDNYRPRSNRIRTKIVKTRRREKRRFFFPSLEITVGTRPRVTRAALIRRYYYLFGRQF